MSLEKTGGLQYISSNLLGRVKGITHSFPCKSGTPGEPLEDLRNRLKEPFGVKGFLTVNQVHGTDVLIYDGPIDNAPRFRTQPYDAVVTSTPGLAAGVRTADCVPILIAAGGAVATVHGGWKGLLGGIIEITVEKMEDAYNIDPLSSSASIGPHILAGCYEVGPDVAEPFAKKFGDTVLKPGEGDRSFLDLETAARMALRNAGLSPENIDSSGECTHCKPDLFYSYRRDGKLTGRQLSFIMID